MTFQTQLASRIGIQELRMSGDHRYELRLDFSAVVIEIDHCSNALQRLNGLLISTEILSRNIRTRSAARGRTRIAWGRTCIWKCLRLLRAAAQHDCTHQDRQ